MADLPAQGAGPVRADARHGCRRQGGRGPDRQGLRDQGVGVLVLSTEPETVLTLADRIMVMKKGRIVARIRQRDRRARTGCWRRPEAVEHDDTATRRATGFGQLAARPDAQHRAGRHADRAGRLLLRWPAASFATLDNVINILTQVSITGDHRRRPDLRHPDRRDRPVGRRHRQCHRHHGRLFHAAGRLREHRQPAAAGLARHHPGAARLLRARPGQRRSASR